MSSDDLPFVAAAQCLVETARRMVADGLSIGTAGNLSCKVGDLIAITPSGVPYEDMTAQDICLLRADGTQVAGVRCPSSETPLHLSIYASTHAGAVVHTHSPEVVAVSTVLDELPAIHYAITDLGGPVRVVPYTLFGSQELAERTVAALQGRCVALLQNHGAVTYGKSLAHAYQRALLIEWLAGVYRRASTIGTPRVLSGDELDQVRAEVHRRRYGQS